DLPVRPPFYDVRPGQAVAVPGPAPDVDLVLLIVLLVIFPPAGLVYWIICHRQSRSVVNRIS
ncbi:MAG TPA: hypothetical protein VIV12_04710, partial [Streptosporangiaceae bacterium]